ncbi:hypothetical protein MMC11_001124 [Xylographa trunciseda]|nr:hypothetical protein [Xylographa trunciseda]
MPASGLFISGEVSDDDSSLSVNSTIPSEQRDEYPLEGILAERVSNGVKEYLVKWEGYPDERCTWETVSNFQNDTTIPEWEHKKMRIKRKLEKPYDVSALEAKVETWVAETTQRKARRRAKRIRMGLPVAPEEIEEEEPSEAEYHGESSSSEATEEDLVPLDSPPRLQTEANRRKKFLSFTAIKSEQDGARVSLGRQKVEKNAVLVQQRRLRRKSNTVEEDSETAEEFIRGRSLTEEPLIQHRHRRNIDVAQEPNQRPLKRPSDLSKEPKQAQDNHTLNTLLERQKSQPDQKPLPDHTRSLPRPISSLHKPSGSAAPNLGQAGRGPARLGQARKLAVSGRKPRVTGAAILGNWAAKIRTRKPLALQQQDIRDDAERSRNFGKLSIKRRYEKAGRYEPAPNPDDLTFVNLKDGRPMKKPASILAPIPYKTPFQMIQDGLAQASEPAVAPGDIDMVDVAEGDDDANMILDARTDSPQDVEEGGTLMQSGYPHSHQKTSVQASDVLQGSRTVSTPSITQMQRSAGSTFQSRKADVSRRASVPSATDQSTFLSFEAHDSSGRRESEQSSVVARKLVPVERSLQAVTTPTHERAFQPSVGGGSVWGERREPSRHESVGQLPVGSIGRTDIPSESLDTMERLSLPILQGDSGYHSGLRSNNYDSYQHEYKALDNFSDILGTIITGLEHREVADVRFRGLTKACKHHFMRIKVPPRQMHVWCKHVCTAEDFIKYFHTEKDMYYGAGHIVPWPSNQSVMNTMTDTLINHNAGGLFFSPSYSLVVYPSGVNSWRFFDDRFVNSPQAALRFVMFIPIPGLLNHTVNNMAQIPELQTGGLESEANRLFRHFFGIKYTNLLWQGSTNNARKDNFYLMYPIELADEKNLISRWLESNNAKVYSSFDVGDWDRFTSSVEAGVVLIHESVFRLHVIPGLVRLLRRPFNMFFINLRPNPSALEQNPPKSGLTRLFPHGGSILLTDSLFLNCPEAAVRILTWFRIYILHSKPNGTWKLVSRPRLRDWILSIVEERTKEEGHVFMQIYEQIYYLLPFELMDETDYETPKDEAPLVSSRGIPAHDLRVGLGDKRHDVEGIARNDNVLAEWYAGWTRTKVEFRRRFQIVHGEKEGSEQIRKSWMKKWSYIAALTPDEFFKIHSVAAWEVKDKEKAEQRHKEREKRKSSAAGLEQTAPEEKKRPRSRRSSVVQ